MTNYVKIAPSILSSNFSKLGEEITTLDNSECDYIHIDVMDGHFVPNLTLGPGIVKSIRPYTKKIFDVHLMINPVMNILPSFINAGSDIITFHCEVNEDLKEIITKIKKGGIKCGLAIKPKTPWTEIKPYLNFVDQIIIMTVEPGFGGQEFMNDQVDKIKHISNYVKANDLNVNIEIDGGINYETGKICVDAGANILVAGSFLFNQGDLITTTNKLYDNFN